MNKIQIRNDEMVADLYLPYTEFSKKLATIILISGIDGGLPSNNAIPLYFIKNEYIIKIIEFLNENIV